MRKSRVLGLVMGVSGALMGVACAGEPTAETAGTNAPERRYDDQQILVGEFTGFVDEEGMHLTLAPSAEFIAAGGEGVAVEELIQVTGATGNGRGLNTANTVEAITCSATNGCAAQYGTGVIVAALFSPASGSYSAACGTVPGGRSTTCYAADVEVRDFIELPAGTMVEISNVYATFTTTGSTGGTDVVLPYDGTPPVLGAPAATLNNTTYQYGTLEPGTPLPGPANLDSPFHQASLRRWRFSYPAGTTDFNFTFSGSIYATVAAGHAPHQASVTPAGAGTSTAFTSACVSDNGNYHVGTSIEPTTGVSQVWMQSRRNHSFEWVSRSSGGALGNGASINPCISPDGSVVVFESTATNLALSDTNATSDIFARVVTAGTTQHISRDSGGFGGSNCGTGGSVFPSVSADGRYVVFNSTCNSFCTGQGGCAVDRHEVYRFDRTLSILAGVSRPNGSTTTFANAPAQTASISGDGNLVAFQSGARNLTGDPNTVVDIFVRNMTTNTTWRITNDSGLGYRIGQISRNGGHVVLASTSTSLVPGITDTSDLDVFRCTVSATSTCAVASLTNGSTSLSGTGASGSASLVGASISADGSLVAFQSDATNLVTGDANGTTDIFVRNFATNATTRISVNSVGAEGNGASTLPRFSTNTTGNNYVTFTSAATNLLFDSAGTGGFDSTDGTATDAFSIRL